MSVTTPDDWETQGDSKWLGSAFEGQIIPLTRTKRSTSRSIASKTGSKIRARRRAEKCRNPRTQLAIEERWFNDGTADRVRLQFIPTERGRRRRARHPEIEVTLVLSRNGGTSFAAATDGISEPRQRFLAATLCELSSQLSARTPGVRLAEAQRAAAELTLESWPRCISEERTAWFPGIGFRPSPHGVWPLRGNGPVDGLQLGRGR